MCPDITTQIENSSSEKFNSKLIENVLNEQIIDRIKQLSKREDIYDLLTRSLGGYYDFNAQVLIISPFDIWNG